MVILKQPLVHFLFIGAMLFVLFEFMDTGRQEASNRILVDRETLLSHLQTKYKSFDTEQVGPRLDQMSAADRQLLIEDFIREEALYREAISLGLDSNDYVIRHRLIQKVEYLLTGFEEARLSDQDLLGFFQDHIDDYFIPAKITFTHVFLSAEENGPSIQGRAKELLLQLENEKIEFASAQEFGDRFPFHRNYVDRDRTFVASHFGQVFAGLVFDLQPGAWQGPLESAYGLHLVLLTNRTDGRSPEFREVAKAVTYDAQQAAIAEEKAVAIDKLLNRYEVVLEL